MTDQIASRSMMFDRGGIAFVRGHGINDHNMNPGAPAIEDWQKGWKAAQAAYLRAVQPQAEVVKAAP